MLQKKIHRRDFVKGAVAAGILGGWQASTVYSQSTTSQVKGANDEIQVAVIGMHNKGKQHIKMFHEIPGVRVRCLCDVDSEVLGQEAAKFAQRNETVTTYDDPRRVLDDKNIDAIVVEVPDHWHALLTIWACQAGKDVYVEKPLAHDIWEGDRMLEAARKYNRIVQVGTQRRSDPGWKEAIDYIQAGNLGKIKVVRALHYRHRDSIGKVDGPQPIPPSINYNLWTGPAPLLPLMRKKLHYNWHWFWTYGCGEIINNGVHYIDLCRWLIDWNDLPPQVISVGGRFGWDDNGQTANTHIAFWDTKPAPIIIEIRNLYRKKGEKLMDHFRGARGGPIIECEGGYYSGGWIYDNQGKKIKQVKHDGGWGHQANFIKAVRSRNIKDLNADILEGLRSTAFGHLANMSHRVGTIASPETIRDRLAGNELFLEVYDRMEQHLQSNELTQQATLGSFLKYDAQNQTCIADDSLKTLMANSLLKRNYRKNFTVPDTV